LLSGVVESSSTIAELCCQTMSCHAQVLKSHAALSDSAYYCHMCLARKVPLLATLEDKTAWIDAVLYLADWYLIVMDLSHAEHCLAAARIVITSTTVTSSDVDPPVTADAATWRERELQLVYLTSSLLTKISGFTTEFQMSRRTSPTSAHGEC